MRTTPTAFEGLMDGFGVVTVMNARIYTLGEDGANESYLGRPVKWLTPGDFKPTTEILDTLKIANFTQEGPTKTITGGQYANPLIKYGKTMTCEMQDALGRASTLIRFFGCETDKTASTGMTRISVTDKFPGPFAIEGETFFIDQSNGNKVPVWIFIPQFTPDAILTLTQDAEGDATVFDLNGSVSVTSIADSVSGTGAQATATNGRDIFYEIRSTSFFASAS
jgi:hypothetical protein